MEQLTSPDIPAWISYLLVLSLGMLVARSNVNQLLASQPGHGACVVREGRDLTVATVSKSGHDALAAAQTLTSDGIELEVIDLRTLRPLDRDTVRESVTRTNRLVVVEEGPRTGGWSGEVLGDLAQDALEHLDDAWRLTTPDAPIPYSPTLEDAFLPAADHIAASVREHLARA